MVRPKASTGRFSELLLDWAKVWTGYKAPGMPLSKVQEVDQVTGEVRWDKKRGTRARGSADSSMYLLREWCPEDFVCPSQELVQLDGNLVKFLQGHNVYGLGIVSLEDLVVAVMDRVSKDHPEWGIERVPGVPVVGHPTRFDYTVMSELPSSQHVMRTLAVVRNAKSRSGDAEVEARSQSKGLAKARTVYLQKHGKRWTFKFYGKGPELLSRGHEIHDFKLQEICVSVARNMFRVELTLRGPELRDLNWREFTIEDFWRFLDRTTVRDLLKGTGRGITDYSHDELNRVFNIKDFKSIKSVQEITKGGKRVKTNEDGLTKFEVKHWRLYLKGIDIHPPFISRSAWFQLRQRVLKAYSVDIDVDPGPQIEARLGEPLVVDLDYIKSHVMTYDDFPPEFQATLFDPEKEAARRLAAEADELAKMQGKLELA